MLAASLLMPITMSAEPRGNQNNRSNTERTTNNHRQSGSTGRPGGGNHNRPNNNGQGRPGGNNNNGHPNNNGNGNRPGSNMNDKKGHDKNHGNYRHNNGNSHNRPGGPAYRPNTPPPPPPRPGGHGPGWRPGSSAMAPGNHRPHNHPPRLGYMVNHAMRGGRYDNVWMVAPGQYAVRYMLNGLWYMQYIWPETGVYGTPFRVVMASPGEWYAYGNRNQWYYDDGASLRISLNGTPQNPWTLVPSIELNINL